MSGFKKGLFLFLALLLPVIIFLFLKSFGKNEFSVEPLFQDGVERPSPCQSFSYTTPYTIPDSILSKIEWSVNDSITLFIFDDKNHDNRIKKHSQIERITKEFESERLTVMCIVEKGEAQWLNNARQRLKVVELAPGLLTTYRNCVFLLKESDNAVLIDPKKRIRGQYNLHDLEDADRLFVHELNILFKRY